LQQCLLNYHSNAIKFTQSGGSISVSCELKKLSNELSITVTDTGCGISNDDQKKLFKMFGFLEATQEVNTKGIGLGLHIVKLITEQFGGQVAVESVLGRGSTFTFSFILDKTQRARVEQHRIFNPNSVRSINQLSKVASDTIVQSMAFEFADA
jgi:signal transduction histidine kinase